MISREELFEWLETCPTNGWYSVGEDEGYIRILFEIDEEDADEYEDE
jgi:hypothetical protein